MTDARRARMFPLGSALFPRGVMPLHVFEPRYLTMMSEALADDGTFGVTLIERGWEVGGGDQRFSVGTMGTIARTATLEDGRMAVWAVGTSRFRVLEWLDVDPYPAAVVEPFPDGDPEPGLPAAVEAARRTLRKLLALASELGAAVGNVDVGVPEDPRDALWTLCAAAPLEQLDRQRLLEIGDPLPRAETLTGLLEDGVASLQAQLGGG